MNNSTVYSIISFIIFPPVKYVTMCSIRPHMLIHQMGINIKDMRMVFWVVSI